MRRKRRTIRCGLIGYGGAFNMGLTHGRQIEAVPGLELRAVCDIDPARTAQAAEDWPGIETYNDAEEMLEKADIDLVTVITPHNSHAELAILCLNAGKHVVVEKPMCLTMAEADAMIDAARKNKVMLSVYHNRRYDGDFMTLLELCRKNILGEIFRVEMWHGGFRKPRKDWWRSDKAISGGTFYDWGAHYLDWLLNIVPARVETVAGYFQPNILWKDISNEDHVEAIIKFANGCVANVQFSTVAAIGKPRWRILGTKGAAQSEKDHFAVNTEVRGMRASMTVPYRESAWHRYYENIADHLLRGKELYVKPEEARRVIAIMELAEKSSEQGKPLPMPYD